METKVDVYSRLSCSLRLSLRGWKKSLELLKYLGRLERSGESFGKTVCGEKTRETGVRLWERGLKEKG